MITPNSLADLRANSNLKEKEVIVIYVKLRLSTRLTCQGWICEFFWGWGLGVWAGILGGGVQVRGNFHKLTSKKTSDGVR